MSNPFAHETQDELALYLGRIPVVDARDKFFPMAAELPEIEPPLEKVWPYTGPVLNQGKTSRCVGYAWTYDLLAAPTVHKRGSEISRDPDTFAKKIYDMGQERDEWPGVGYEGTSVRGVAKALQELRRLGSYHWATSVSVATKFLRAKGGIVGGFPWFEGMFFPDKHGYIEPTGDLIGGHAVWLPGFSSKRSAVRGLCAWGEKWAQKGRFWMHTDVLQDLLPYSELCCGRETRPTEEI